LVAVAQDCGRFEWSVLDWNTFHRVLRQPGAQPQEWIHYRMTGQALLDRVESLQGAGTRCKATPTRAPFSRLLAFGGQVFSASRVRPGHRFCMFEREA
jgi:hypothetical protein